MSSIFIPSDIFNNGSKQLPSTYETLPRSAKSMTSKYCEALPRSRYNYEKWVQKSQVMKKLSHISRFTIMIAMHKYQTCSARSQANLSFDGIVSSQGQMQNNDLDLKRGDSTLSMHCKSHSNSR